MNTDSIHVRLDLKGARAALVDRLEGGEKVNGLTLSDLISSDLMGPRCDEAVLEVTRILVSEYPDTPLYQSRYVQGVIGRYLDSHEELVHEHAEQMLDEEPA